MHLKNKKKQSHFYLRTFILIIEAELQKMNRMPFFHFCYFKVILTRFNSVRKRNTFSNELIATDVVSDFWPIDTEDSFGGCKIPFIFHDVWACVVVIMSAFAVQREAVGVLNAKIKTLAGEEMKIINHISYSVTDILHLKLSIKDLLPDHWRQKRSS